MYVHFQKTNQPYTGSEKFIETLRHPKTLFFTIKDFQAIQPVCGWIASDKKIKILIVGLCAKTLWEFLSTMKKTTIDHILASNSEILSISGLERLIKFSFFSPNDAMVGKTIIAGQLNW